MYECNVWYIFTWRKMIESEKIYQNITPMLKVKVTNEDLYN